jgi:hypothetical protein
VATINERIAKFISDLATDPIEERVVEYIIREVGNGRRLGEVLDDPFVRNRLNDDRRAQVIENPEIVDALDAEIRQALKTPDIGFSS